jgi:hypothetical protein
VQKIDRNCFVFLYLNPAVKSIHLAASATDFACDLRLDRASPHATARPQIAARGIS